MKACMNLEVNLKELAIELRTDEAFYLIKQIDFQQHDFEFTVEVIHALIKSLLKESDDVSENEELKKCVLSMFDGEVL